MYPIYFWGQGTFQYIFRFPEIFLFYIFVIYQLKIVSEPKTYELIWNLRQETYVDLCVCKNEWMKVCFFYSYFNVYFKRY